MSFILRKLDRKAAFYPQAWLGRDDVQADALKNLRTQGNKLSVWQVDSDRANLNRIIAALAAARDTLDKLDYALIEEQSLTGLGLQCIPERGGSFDDDANSRWHQDLRCLTGSSLLGLARLIRAQAELNRVSKADVATMIIDSIETGFIDRTQIPDQLRNALGA